MRTQVSRKQNAYPFFSAHFGEKTAGVPVRVYNSLVFVGRKKYDNTARHYVAHIVNYSSQFVHLKVTKAILVTTKRNKHHEEEKLVLVFFFQVKVNTGRAILSSRQVMHELPRKQTPSFFVATQEES